MLTRLIAAALFAGLAAGLLVAGLQSCFVTPMIFKAESFEAQGEHPHTHAPGEAAHDHGHDHGAAGHSHGEGEWQPADGAERLTYTALATVATAVGYALILGALMTLAGAPFNTESVLKWSLGAFIATTLAPGFGLSPSLPGMGETALEPRQIWWIGTALATGAGLYIMTHYRQTALAIAGGLALIALPHIVGAPVADLSANGVPARLGAQFASSTMTLAFILWMALGFAFGVAYSWLARSSAEPTAA